MTKYSSNTKSGCMESTGIMLLWHGIDAATSEVAVAACQNIAIRLCGGWLLLCVPEMKIIEKVNKKDTQAKM